MVTTILTLIFLPREGKFSQVFLSYSQPRQRIEFGSVDVFSIPWNSHSLAHYSDSLTVIIYDHEESPGTRYCIDGGHLLVP